jgi:hypothetical protein
MFPERSLQAKSLIEIKTTTKIYEDANYPSINDAIPEQPRYRKQKVI